MVKNRKAKMTMSIGTIRISLIVSGKIKNKDRIKKANAW